MGAAVYVALASLVGRSGGFRWGVSLPTWLVLTISILLALAALLVSSGIVSLPFSALGLLATAYILLLLGNLLKGLEVFKPDLLLAAQLCVPPILFNRHKIRKDSEPGIMRAQG